MARNSEYPEVASLARALAEAERDSRKLAAAELTVPDSFEAALAVQAATLRALGTPAVAWKVAIRPDGQSVGAPIARLGRFGPDGRASLAGWGAEAIEVEIAFRLGAELPPPEDATEETVRAAVAAVHLGVEVIRLRLVEGPGAPFPLFLADRLGNGGYLLGPDIAPGRLAALPPLAVRGDGETVFEGTAAHPNGDPLAPLVAWAKAPVRGAEGPRAGQVVTTGSFCGVVPLGATERLEIDWMASLTIERGG
ncbi:hypothetical protein [Tistlia consotensis]|nr:hypothetical protein [Tistlia consotensis]